jgi:hypothetical protein
MHFEPGFHILEHDGALRFVENLMIKPFVDFDGFVFGRSFILQHLGTAGID